MGKLCASQQLLQLSKSPLKQIRKLVFQLFLLNWPFSGVNLDVTLQNNANINPPIWVTSRFWSLLSDICLMGCESRYDISGLCLEGNRGDLFLIKRVLYFVFGSFPCAGEVWACCVCPRRSWWTRWAWGTPRAAPPTAPTARWWPSAWGTESSSSCWSTASRSGARSGTGSLQFRTSGRKCSNTQPWPKETAIESQVDLQRFC